MKKKNFSYRLVIDLGVKYVAALLNDAWRFVVSTLMVLINEEKNINVEGQLYGAGMAEW